MGASLRLSAVCAVLLAVVFATPASAVRRYSKYHHKAHYRHVAWNPVLRAASGSQLRQNEEVDRLQLPRIADDTQLEELERNQELVQVQETKALRISPVIHPTNRTLPPWSNQFLFTTTT